MLTERLRDQVGEPPSVAEGQFNVPVVFFVFNRPEETRRVFERIARVRPERLLVISDAPRTGKSGEAEKVAETRGVTEAVDWPCVVSREYAVRNMGCKARLSSGLNWAFGLVEHAVILEDDCVPSDTFFAYAKEMLELYREDKRVMSISGSRFGEASGDVGHYLSNYALMWGWATWRDRWALYDLSASDYAKVIIARWWRRPLVMLYWLQVLRSVALGWIDTWDYQWILSVWRQEGMVCRPTVNLVQNIGHGINATHTRNENNPLALIAAEETSLGFASCRGDASKDRSWDSADESLWAGIGLRSNAIMLLKIFGVR